ncbi:MAG: ATP-binding cassette subfamily B protein [Alteromonadaceae bacterium]|jgi:ATP-binding cassette subfamily B protein
MGMVISTVFSPMQVLTNLGLSKTVQVSLLSSLFVANKLTESKVANRKEQLWIEYSSEVDENLSQQVIQHIQSLPMSYLENQSTEKLMNLVKNDVDAIKRFLGYTPAIFTEKATAIAIGTGVLLAVSPVGLLLGLLPIPYMSKLNKKQKEAVAERSAQSRALDDEFNQLMSNNLNGLLTVKSFTAEAMEVDRLDDIKQQANHHKVEIDRANSYDGNATELVFNLGLTVPLIYTCLNVLSGKIGMTGFMFQNSMSPNILRSATGLEQGKSLYHNAHSASTRLDKLLTAPKEQSEGQRPEQLIGKITFDHLKFGYHQQPVLNDISIEIGARQKVAFVGPTCSGKSTLIKLLLQFYACEQGGIYLDDQNINDIELQSLRQSVSPSA